VILKFEKGNLEEEGGEGGEGKRGGALLSIVWKPLGDPNLEDQNNQKRGNRVKLVEETPNF
jgi:hypothetical protein